jgi:hypothetical protein
MNITIKSRRGLEIENANTRKIGIFHVDYQLDEIDYFFENKRFLIFVDTNITKDREPEILASLDNLIGIYTDEISRIFNGNYFLVAIDKIQKKVHLMRDVCGVKTGYFTQENNSLIIGSVMHDVAAKQSQIKYNENAIGQLLYSGFLMDGSTVYEGVEELKMGYKLSFNSWFNLEKTEKETLTFAEKDNDLSAEENIKELREQTVKAHKGFLGEKNRVFLSGGLDSIAMLAALDDLYECKNLDSVSFKVKGTTQDETVYAESIANHLSIDNRIKEIDAEDKSNVANFEERVLRMNNPYFGTWIFGNFSGTPNQMYYAGQDSRLHTPAVNEIDKFAYSLLPYRNSFLIKNIARPVAKVAQKIMESFGWQKGKTMIQRNLYKASFIFDLDNYLGQFFFKLNKEAVEKAGLPTDYYDKFAEYYQIDLNEISTARGLYNKLGELKWKEQYVYDMRYLQDLGRINNTYVAMPFYSKEYAEFTSSIPFNLATKPMLGRSRFGKTRRIIYKYVLRHAFRDKLNDLCFYRAKAVSQTLYQLFNGALGTTVREVLERDLQEENSFIKMFKLENYIQKFLDRETFGMEDENLMMTSYYISTLTVWHKHVFQAKLDLTKENVTTV